MMVHTGAASINLVYHRLGSLIDFIKNPPKVLSDNAKHDDHQAKQERDQSHDRCETGHISPSQYRIDGDYRSIAEAGKGNQYSNG